MNLLEEMFSLKNEIIICQSTRIGSANLLRIRMRRNRQNVFGKFIYGDRLRDGRKRRGCLWGLQQTDLLLRTLLSISGAYRPIDWQNKRSER